MKLFSWSFSIRPAFTRRQRLIGVKSRVIFHDILWIDIRKASPKLSYKTWNEERSVIPMQPHHTPPPAAGVFSYNEATPVPHPRSPRAARGDSSGPTERPKRGLPRNDRPLFVRSSGPNTPVESFWQLMIGFGRRISGVPGVIRKARIKLD